ncbi:MAG: hypothetical protein H8E12_14820 [Rhodobacteraceae bacterium]|nr:hypothetical protein [Paracoccaceae bacterium]
MNSLLLMNSIVMVLLCLCVFLAIQWYKNIGIKLLLAEQKLQYAKLLGQKKSSEVITGQIAEKLAPFLKDFKHDPQQATFCGQPIDYLVFGENEITFVEIKSGNSRLSAKQKRIKNQIQAGRVVWEEIRIK